MYRSFVQQVKVHFNQPGQLYSIKNQPLNKKDNDDYGRLRDTITTRTIGLLTDYKYKEKGRNKERNENKNERVYALASEKLCYSYVIVSHFCEWISNFFFFCAKFLRKFYWFFPPPKQNQNQRIEGANQKTIFSIVWNEDDDVLPDEIR